MDVMPRHSVQALARAADELLTAEELAAPIRPLSESLAELSIDDAYVVQTLGREQRLRAGPRVVGHKIGLTSLAMQEMVGVDQPDYGYLLDSMVSADGTTLDAATLIAPRVEAEIAFYLARPLAGPAITVQDVLAATESIAPALEVIDSRIVDWRITIVDTIADNASSAHAVVGARQSADQLDLAGLTMVMDVDGTQVEGRGDAVLGHPAEAVAWLARALHRQGEALEAGDLVLSGALARALPVAPGARAHAVLDVLGSVTATFSARGERR